VLLEGTVSTKAMHEVILETVRGVPGVHRVIDHLHLEPH
jgi:osmotically-inducible protein OsmY